MNILVTGGAGYIGSHTVKELALAGHNPVVLDDLSRGHRQSVKWGPLVECRCGDEETVYAALLEHKIEAVIHFAAFAYVGESVHQPRLYFENNAFQTLRLLNAMHRAHVRRIVFSSTCATYGDAKHVPIDENHPQHPVNPYGESKLFVEKMLAALGQAEGLQWVALRYFNASGADPDGELGEEHDPEPHLIPRAILNVLGKADLQVFGTDYPTPDGTAVRDYIHVKDLAAAHLKSVQHLVDGGRSLAMNLGTGTGVSVMKVLQAIEKCSGRKTSAVMAPRREGDPPELVADPRLARDVLNWECRYSDLETIVETAWRWHTRG
jgi:UDP-glucose-4-epimerase GalE